MRGSDWQAADDAKIAQERLEELILLRFKGLGDSMDDIARRYSVERWVVESIIRDELKRQAPSETDR